MSDIQRTNLIVEKGLLNNFLENDLFVGATYTAGDFLVIGFRFLLLLIYGTLLSTPEYGILAITASVSAIAGILITFGLKGAAFKQHFDYTSEREKKEFYGSIWLFLVIGAFIATLTIDMTGQLGLFGFLKNVPYDPFIRLALWNAYLTNAFSTILFEILRVNRKPAQYVALAFGNAATLLASAYVLVVYFELGIIGALFSTLLTGIVWGPIYTMVIRKYLTLTINFDMIRRALSYSFPLLPHFLAHWLLNFSDRLILEKNVGLANLGIYSFGYNVATTQQIFVNSGNSTIMPYFGKAQDDAEEGASLPKIFSRYILVVAATALAISVFSDEVIKIIFPPQFHASGQIVSWIVLGFFSIGLYYGPMNILTLVAGHTKNIWILTAIAGALNVIANLVLVPRFGILAAAVNTLLGYFFLFLLVFFYARKLSSIKLELKRLSLISLGLLIGIFIDESVNPSPIWQEFLIDALVFVSFVLVYFRVTVSRINSIWSKPG